MAKNQGNEQMYGDESMGGGGDYEDNINWDEVGSVCPEGVFDFVVEEAKYQLSGKTNKHMVVVRFKVEGAHDPELAESAANKSVFENFVFTQAAGFRIKGFAKAATLDLPESVNKVVLEEWAEQLPGLKVTGQVKHRMFNDESRAQITKFMTYGQTEEGETEQEPEKEKPKASGTGKGIRQAVADQKANGHSKTNGHAAKAPAKKPPASKTVSQKAQARR